MSWRFSIVCLVVALGLPLSAACGYKKCTSDDDCPTGCDLTTGLCEGMGPLGGGFGERGGGASDTGGGGGGSGTVLGCTPATCPNGCCAGSVCRPGLSQRECGYGGSACVECPPVASCEDNACIATAPMDNLPSAVCQFPSDCLAADGLSTGGDCPTFTQPDGGPDSPFCFPGCSTDLDCRTIAATCVPVLGQGRRCLANCVGPGTGQGSCRGGFLCRVITLNDGGTTPWGVCLPP